MLHTRYACLWMESREFFIDGMAVFVHNGVGVDHEETSGLVETHRREVSGPGANPGPSHLGLTLDENGDRVEASDVLGVS